MMPDPGFEIAAIRTLTANDPVMARVIAGVGPCSLQPDRGADLFQALLRSIVFQQLHGKAATAIHTRVVALMPELTAAAFQELSDASLRAAGLSANKLGALRDLAAKTLEDTIPTVTAAIELSDDALVERLTSVRGVGPWTVQMLMIFYLGRPDVLPSTDFGIRKAFSLLYRRGRPVTPKAVLRHAQRWQPYRSTASWYLWRSLDLATLDRSTPESESDRLPPG